MAKNSEVYKTAQERAEAFTKYCDQMHREGSHGQFICKIDKPCPRCTMEWLDLEAEEKPSICVSKSDNIQIGDTVAYKTMDDNKDEWACFTVRAMDNEYFYENADHSGDNIAKGCCHKVNVDRIIVSDEEKPLPCPFCGSECKLDDLNRVVNCTKCDYMSGGDIAAHNRVAKAVRESEGKREN